MNLLLISILIKVELPIKPSLMIDILRKFIYTMFSTIVQDFDLCISCKEKDGHPHHMERLGLDLDDGSSPADAKQANPQVRVYSIFGSFDFFHLKSVSDGKLFLYLF